MSQLPPEEPVDRREVTRSTGMSDGGHEGENYVRDRDLLERREKILDNPPPVVREERFVRDDATERVLTANKLSQLVWLVVGIVAILLALRVVLELIGANASAAFASFIYGASEPFVAPFYGLTGTPTLGTSFLDVPAILAIIVYALLGWIVVRVIQLVLAPTTARVSSTEERFRDHHTVGS